ncbi:MULTISPECIES: S1C family serine protease [Paenibacillus]|uniref:S1C family serine protease n=1 Tax=Paenibacillus TaxID=44249 RepID=UPI00201D561E|nr:MULTISPECIES: trypsin-like peptidase domain-containing protein [Paenibacillus]MCL6662047.1 trypsin-like peptidase domain-containing protein [Paenibacillus amylolyticus]WJM07815.1 trypsin-like peptidase domain-containing protein [Paenibacillus sp. PK1-4R]
MSVLGKKGIAILMAAVLSISVAATAGAAESKAAMQAKVVDGQVYVNTKDLLKAVGGSGQYDAKSGTYTYKGSEAIPSVIEKVSPSVVGIIGKSTEVQDGATSDDRYNLAHGTGVIIRSNGWIVTNAHVVDGLTNPVVVTTDGNTYKITKTYSDALSDLALIKINAKSLKPASFAKASQTTVGETVIALGTPISFSLRNSATVGVISGLNRGVEATYRLIQTDTAINPGNSGGPLVNLKGEVVGINSMKFSAVGVESLGFSIPVDTVQYIIDQFFKYGKIKRASLGLQLEESWSAIVGLPTDDPLTITGVLSPEAKKAKIKEGDVLYSVAGTRVSSVVDINELLKKYLPGQKVKLLMQSDGDIVTRTLMLADRADIVDEEDEAFLADEEQ